jgi:hypothetical protein
MSLATVRLSQQVHHNLANSHALSVLRWLTALLSLLSLLPPSLLSLPLSSLCSGVPRSTYDAAQPGLPRGTRLEWWPEAGGTVYARCASGGMHGKAEGAVTRAITLACHALGIQDDLHPTAESFTAADGTEMLPDGGFFMIQSFCNTGFACVSMAKVDCTADNVSCSIPPLPLSLASSLFSPSLPRSTCSCDCGRGGALEPPGPRG